MKRSFTIKTPKAKRPGTTPAPVQRTPDPMSNQTAAQVLYPGVNNSRNPLE